VAFQHAGSSGSVHTKPGGEHGARSQRISDLIVFRIDGNVFEEADAVPVQQLAGEHGICLIAFVATVNRSLFIAVGVLDAGDRRIRNVHHRLVNRGAVLVPHDDGASARATPLRNRIRDAGRRQRVQRIQAGERLATVRIDDVAVRLELERHFHVVHATTAQLELERLKHCGTNACARCHELELLFGELEGIAPEVHHAAEGLEVHDGLVAAKFGFTASTGAARLTHDGELHFIASIGRCEVFLDYEGLAAAFAALETREVIHRLGTFAELL